MQHLLTSLLALVFVVHSVQAQQPCVVTTAQEFKDALFCIANCSACSLCPSGCSSTEILIPATHPVTQDPVVIEIGTIAIPYISIGTEHSNSDHRLTITIRGTLKWVDGPSCQNCGYTLLRINEATHLTIDGDGVGRMTSDLDPEENWLPTAIALQATPNTLPFVISTSIIWDT